MYRRVRIIRYCAILIVITIFNFNKKKLIKIKGSFENLLLNQISSCDINLQKIISNPNTSATLRSEYLENNLSNKFNSIKESSDSSISTTPNFSSSSSSSSSFSSPCFYYTYKYDTGLTNLNIELQESIPTTKVFTNEQVELNA